MSAEDNKKVVMSFFENFTAGKAEAALGQMADTATWTVMGRPENFALAGTKTKAQFTELLKGIGAAMPKGLRLTPKALTAEGDRVAVEAESMANMRTVKSITTSITSLSNYRTARFKPSANTSTPSLPKTYCSDKARQLLVFGARPLVPRSPAAVLLPHFLTASSTPSDTLLSAASLHARYTQWNIKTSQ